MTQEELSNNIYRLMCCSGTLANDLSIEFKRGSKCQIKITDLIILNDSIELLLKYNLADNSINCLTESEFNSIYTKAINICKLCDCK